MKIGIVGYGKMGHMVEQRAAARGHEVLWRANSYEELVAAVVNGQEVDVAIEFSSPAAVVENLRFCLSHGMKVVCGTTGWYFKLQDVLAIQAQHPASALFYAPNFSLGVRVVSLLTQQLARYEKLLPQYDVSIEETHHTAKLDAPSCGAVPRRGRKVQGVGFNAECPRRGVANHGAPYWQRAGHAHGAA